jgi:hypothetical protein
MPFMTATRLISTMSGDGIGSFWALRTSMMPAIASGCFAAPLGASSLATHSQAVPDLGYDVAIFPGGQCNEILLCHSFTPCSSARRLPQQSFRSQSNSRMRYTKRSKNILVCQNQVNSRIHLPDPRRIVPSLCWNCRRVARGSCKEHSVQRFNGSTVQIRTGMGMAVFVRRSKTKR